MKESECKRGLRELKMGFSENEFDVSQVHAGCPKVSKGNENGHVKKHSLHATGLHF